MSFSEESGEEREDKQDNGEIGSRSVWFRPDTYKPIDIWSWCEARKSGGQETKTKTEPHLIK